jgi:hypothetical protein
MNESTHLYKVYVDNSIKCPTLRIEWLQTSDILPTFINSLPDWQKRKIYDYMRDYCINADTSDNKIHHFYSNYNNEDGINYLKTLL